MKWSKLRVELKQRLAESLKERLDYHLTTYKNSSGFNGRAWITWDGIEILNFSNQDTWNTFKSYSNEQSGTHHLTHKKIQQSERSDENILEKGEFSKYDFADTAFTFLNINVWDAIKSENPILRALAVVDRRIGKRTLTALENTEDNPMVKHLLLVRITETRTKPSA